MKKTPYKIKLHKIKKLQNKIIIPKACLRYVHLQWSGSCYLLVQYHSPFYDCREDLYYIHYQIEIDSIERKGKD